MNIIILLFFSLLIGFIPGYCVWRLADIKHYGFIWSHILSLLIFSVALCLGGILRLSWEVTFSLYLICTIIIVAIFFTRNLSNKLLSEISSQNRIHYLCFAAISVGVVLYIAIVGDYDRVPSDILRHLERLQQAYIDIWAKNPSGFSFHNGWNGYYIYYYYASLLSLSGVTLNQLHTWITIFNSIFILFATYQFAVYQFQKKGNVAVCIALCSCLFFILHKGIASFSFIRYYSLSATLLTFPAFYLCTIYFDRWFHQRIRLVEWLFIIFAILFTALLHQQETMFIAIMFVMLVAYYALSYYLKNSKPIVIMANSRHDYKTILILTSLVLVAVSIALFYIMIALERFPSDQDRVIALATWFDFVPSTWEILNPYHQLSQVITLWGLAVYLLTLLHIRRIMSYPILFCSLLIPFVTVLNPLFVDAFMRLRGIDTLYRLLYITPLGLVAAYLLYLSYKDFRSLSSSMLQKSLAVIAALLLIIPLFPINTDKRISSYSRVTDLASVKTDNSLRYWADVSHYLQTSFEKETIFTDPVTGYIVSATTNSYSPRYKFTKHGHSPINFDDYDTDLFRAYAGHLLVINLRDGGVSPSGEISGHWPKDILEVSNYYSAELIEYIKSKPHRLKLIWQANQIRVFRISSD